MSTISENLSNPSHLSSIKPLRYESLNEIKNTTQITLIPVPEILIRLLIWYKVKKERGIVINWKGF